MTQSFSNNSDSAVPTLENWHYLVVLGYPDEWRLHGTVYGHSTRPNGESVGVSTPVVFDKLKKIVTTKSGSRYQLGSCESNSSETTQTIYILEDVAKFGIHLEALRIYELADYVYKSELSDEKKYDYIFSDNISKKIKLDYCDPDTSYGEDVKAFMEAFKEFVDTLK